MQADSTLGEVPSSFDICSKNMEEARCIVCHKDDTVGKEGGEDLAPRIRERRKNKGTHLQCTTMTTVWLW